VRIDRIVGFVAILSLLVAVPIEPARGQESGQYDIPWMKAKKPLERVKPLPAAVASKRKLDGGAPEPWKIEWDKLTGLPKRLWGVLPSKTSGSAEEIASGFLAEYRPLLTGLDSSADDGAVTFGLRKATNYKDFTEVSFEQYYAGLEVYPGGVTVRVDQQDRITGVGGGMHYLIGLPVPPRLSANEAVEALRRVVAPDSLILIDTLRVIVFTRTQSAQIAYEIHAAPEAGHTSMGPFLFYVGAESGELLDWFSLVR